MWTTTPALDKAWVPGHSLNMACKCAASHGVVMSCPVESSLMVENFPMLSHTLTRRLQAGRTFSSPVTVTTYNPVTNACQGLSFLSAVCRLYTTFASATQHTQEGDDTWQAAFKLSYELGCSLLRGAHALPPVHIDHVTSGSHLMRLIMQHQELVAAPTPVAGQGDCPYTLSMKEQVFVCLIGDKPFVFCTITCITESRLVCGPKICAWLSHIMLQLPTC